ncbi:PQQ-binding-like beta-propeller repeat protein [Novipirellula artificiosorum]
MTFLQTQCSLTRFSAAFSSVAAVLMAFASNPACVADDWPGWMGAQRDGVYHETGIVETIPAAGLKVKWRTPIHGGYAGPAVANGHVYVFDYKKESGEAFNDPGKRANLNGKERLLVLDEATGKMIWKFEYDCPYSISYPAGPRCTPTVDGDRVYILGSEGDLHCLKTADGELVWQRSFKDDFSAEVPVWGFAGHPLVEGDTLYCMVGGDGQGVVAFDKNTGAVKWKSLNAKAGYCPPSMIHFANTTQLIVFHPDAVVSLNPSDGSQYWEVPLKPLYEMSIARPMIEGDRMYASGIYTEGVMLKLDADQPRVEELWRGEPKQSVYACNSTPIIVDGILYGVDTGTGKLIAVDSKDGSRLWETLDATHLGETRFLKQATAFLTRVGDTDRYLLMSEIGDLILARLTKDAYEERGRFHVLEPTGEAAGRDVVWSHPAYANRTAYARNDKEIVAVDLADPSK